MADKQPVKEETFVDNPVDDGDSSLSSRTEKAQQEKIRTLKNKQTYALSRVTMHRNELSGLMGDDTNLHLAKSTLEKYNEVIGIYQGAFQQHHDTLDDEDVQTKESERYDAKETSIIAFRGQVQQWISAAEGRLADDLDRTSERSRSTTGSRTSRASCGSCVSERTKAKARLAELLAEKDMVLEKSRLDIDIAIAKARAREKVFAEAENQQNGVEPHSKGDTVKVVKEVNIPMSKPTVGGSNDNTVRIYQTVDPHATVSNGNQPTLSDQIVRSSDNVPTMSQSPVVQTHDYAVHNQNDLPSTLEATTPAFQPRNPPLTTSLSDVQQQIRDVTAAISLPMPEVTKFSGDPTEYHTFMLAFDTRISPRTVQSSDRLYYLRQHLDGEPRELIEGCLYMDPDAGYHEARKLLKTEYGDPYRISACYLSIIREWTPLHHDNTVELKRLAHFLIRCGNAMTTISDLSILDHIPNLQMIVSKLPQYMQNKWRDEVSKLRRREGRYPVFSDVVNFVRLASDSANDPAFSREALLNADPRTAKRPSGKPTFPSKTSSFAVNVDQTHDNEDNLVREGSTKIDCIFCKGPHDVDKCKPFLSKSLDERKEFFRQNESCYGCLTIGHTARGCTNKRTCSRCQRRHPTCLHDDNFNNGYPRHTTRETEGPAGESNTVGGFATTMGSSTVLQAIIPVIVRQAGHPSAVTTYAFYDPGSTGCFILEDLTEELRLK